MADFLHQVKKNKRIDLHFSENRIDKSPLDSVYLFKVCKRLHNFFRVEA